jgi:hypothetical protein
MYRQLKNDIRVLRGSCPSTYLAILQNKHQLHILTINNLLLHLGGNPALSRVRLPGLRANIVGVRHDCIATRHTPWDADMLLLFQVAGVVSTSLALVCAGQEWMYRYNVLAALLVTVARGARVKVILGRGSGGGTIRSWQVKQKGPRLTPALCDAAKQ